MSADEFPDTPAGMKRFHSGSEQEPAAAAVRATVLDALGPQKVDELAQAMNAGQIMRVMSLIEEGHRLAGIPANLAISCVAATVSNIAKSSEDGELRTYQDDVLHNVEKRWNDLFSNTENIVKRYVRGTITSNKDEGFIRTKDGAVIVVQGTKYDPQDAAALVKKYTYRRVVIFGEKIDDQAATVLRNLGFQVVRTKEEFLPYAKKLGSTFGDKTREIIDRAADRFEPVKKITEVSKATREAWEMIPDGLKKPAYMGMKAGSALLAGAMGAYLAAHHPDLKQIAPSFLQQAIEHPQNPQDGVPGLLGTAKKSSRADSPVSSMRRGVA